MKNKIIEEAVEKEFLSIRGWKNWEEYDKIGETLPTEINARKELINIVIKIALQKRDEEELEWLGNLLVMDINKSDFKHLIKLRHIKKLK